MRIHRRLEKRANKKAGPDNEERLRRELGNAHEGPEVIRVIHSAKTKPPQASREERIDNIKKMMENGTRENVIQALTKASLEIASKDEDPVMRRYAAKFLKILDSDKLKASKTH